MKKSTLHILYIKKINEDYNSKTKKKNKKFSEYKLSKYFIKKIDNVFRLYNIMCILN
jgi:hypothetical protein